MKISTKPLIIGALLILSPAGHAQQPPHPPMDMGDGMGMEHNMGAMDPAKMLEHMKKKQEHMLMMHALSNKILAEKDPQKQQALKDQQLELIKAHHQEMMSRHHDKQQDHRMKH